jgi:UDP-N-acetylglucosamine--N-acetylmuramyl-(pentapeptide) pyrophosphoryl-undecaprenol N-acetylglucosamine transferase
MARAALRVVCYAVNGTGVGHLTRLLSIARWLRRYAAALDEKLEIWFLTSSEADALVFSEGFAAFKIPSKTIVAETGIDRTAYLALAKQWIWHTLGLLRPDLLVVDTFPRGSFGELLGALDLCKHKAFVYRPVKPEVASRPDFQAMLGLYDLLLVPEADHAVLVPPQVRDRLVHVGPVLSRERWELLPRDVARARLGVPIAAAAGRDEDDALRRVVDAEAQLARVLAALAVEPSVAVVVGTGPLYRGRPFPGVTTLPGRAAESMLAFDAAVCAAGYNTFGELMFAGVPTAFLPQEKLADDQHARASLAVARGAAALLGPDSDVLAVVKELLARPAARENARSLVPENGARAAAAELLRLVCAPSRVDRVDAALGDALLASIATSGHRHEENVLHLAHRLARDEPATDLARAITLAASLHDGREPRELRGLVDAVVRGLGAGTPLAGRAAVCESTLAALGALTPGDAAAARAAVAESRWGGTAATDGAALANAIRTPRSTGPDVEET